MTPLETIEPSTAIEQVPPLLRWAGSKRRIVPEILARLPARMGRYVEPFAGSASVFFAARGRADRAWLADVNHDLVGMYQAIQRAPAEVELALTRHALAHGEPEYRRVVASFNDGEMPVGSSERAAQVMYLNRAGFNGLWRVSKKSGYNVAWGDRASVAVPTTSHFRAAWSALQGTQITAGDYRHVLTLCGEGDVAYCDPPYPGTFTGYITGGFSKTDYANLVAAYYAAARRGAMILASVNDTPLARELVQPRRGFRVALDQVVVRHAVGATGERRRKVPELLITIERE